MSREMLVEEPEIILVTPIEPTDAVGNPPCPPPNGPCGPMSRPCNPECGPGCGPNTMPRICGPTLGAPKPPAPPKPPGPN